MTISSRAPPQASTEALTTSLKKFQALAYPAARVRGHFETKAKAQALPLAPDVIQHPVGMEDLSLPVAV